MDIQSLMMDKGLSVKPINDGRELRLHCPLCNDHKERMFLNTRTYLWTCHNCSEAGNLYSFLERVLDMDPLETYRAVREIDNYTPRTNKTEDGINETITWPESAIPLRNLSSPIERPFWEYLMGPTRQLDPSTIQEYHMEACVTGQYAMRVLIPIFQDGRLVSFVARAITDKCPCRFQPYKHQPVCGHRWVKVLYPQGPHKAGILFDIDRVRGQEEVILVEGPFDAIRLSGRAVATLGAGVSVSQRALLRKAGFSKVTILYDPDEPGQRASMRAARELMGAGFTVRIANLEAGYDPAIAPSRMLDKALDSAVRIEVLSSASEMRRLF